MSDDANATPQAGTVQRRPIVEMARIAVPTVATMTSYTLMTFTDKWLVSHLGPDFVGAQGNGGLSSWVIISVAQGLLTLVNTFVAQNLGAGKPERGPAYCWNGIWIACAYWLLVLIPLAVALPLVFGVIARGTGESEGMDPRQAALSAAYGSILLWGGVLTLATRCVGQFFFGMHRPGVVMVAGIAANVFNLFVSAVLVFGNAPPHPDLGLFGRAAHEAASTLSIAPMGIAGSAIGTVLATGLELAIPMMVFLSPRFNRLYRTRSQWRPSRSHMKDIVRLGWPAGLMFGNEMVCWGFFMVYLVSHFGRLHSSAGWIAHQYMSLSFMPAVGISVAVTALVGKYQGMGRPDLAAARAWLGVRIACVYMGVCAAVFVLFPTALLSLFIDGSTPTDDAATLIRLGTGMLIATAAFQLFDAVAMVLSSALRGAGDTVLPGVATIICSWVIIVGGGLALVRWAPSLESLGPWIAAAAYIVILCFILLARFLSGKWRHIKLVHREGEPDPAAAQPAMTTDGIA
jgi:MATE family multidrug resistance protein